MIYKYNVCIFNYKLKYLNLPRMKILSLFAVLIFLVSCKKDISTNNLPTAISQEDAITAIPKITIGTQIWMQKNLAVKTYRNGDAIQYIPYEQGNTLWSTTTSGAWCYYNNDPATEAVYGLMYNAFAVLDPRGLAPKGWHVPSGEEWSILTAYLGNASVAGGKIKAISDLWLSPNTGATNSSGFTGLPGGYRAGSSSGTFYNITRGGYWWSTQLSGANSCYAKWVFYDRTNLVSAIFGKNTGVSVRCIKN